MARGFNYAPGASAELQEAMQPGLHKTHLMALGASKNHLVRAAIAGRDDCPWGLMVTLAHDFNAEVRAAIARNPIAQNTVMAYLAADRHTDVLKALLANPSLPQEILDELAFHKKREVRAVAAARLDAGVAPVAEAPAEDEHTPELAEHVLPVSQQMTADGTVAPSLEPVNVVDISTREPILTVPTPTPAPPAPTPTPPTRTAPVRGFTPKE